MLRLSSRLRACAAAFLLMLAGCVEPQQSARFQARASAIDPPQLWRVEAADAIGRSQGALEVCTDAGMRQGFQRADAEVNGQLCLNRSDTVQRPGLFAARCDLNGRLFGLTVNSSGDAAREMKVSFALTALDGSGVQARQVRMFRRLGPCPPGWDIGDQRRLGGGRGENSLSGRWGR